MRTPRPLYYRGICLDDLADTKHKNPKASALRAKRKALRIKMELKGYDEKAIKAALEALS